MHCRRAPRRGSSWTVWGAVPVLEMHPQVVQTQRPGARRDPESICARSIIGIHMTHNCVLRGSARGSPCQPERLNKAAEVQQSGMPIIRPAKGVLYA